jgi:hypothetical protein
VDRSGGLRLPSYDLFSSTEVLGRLAMEKMLAGLSSRRYRAGLEPAGQAVAQTAAATSKSAVSRRFVAATETALAELMSRRLDDLDLVALMIDGVHFGEHTCVVALGIGIDGTKHPLAVEEGSIPARGRRLSRVYPRRRPQPRACNALGQMGDNVLGTHRLLASVSLPTGSDLQLYQPRHPVAHNPGG